QRGIDGSQPRDRGGDGLRGIVGNLAARVNQRYRADALRGDGDEVHADDGAQRMADDVYTVEVERVTERQDIGGVEHDPVAVGGLGAEATSAQIERDHIPSLLSQRRPQRGELSMA